MNRPPSSARWESHLPASSKGGQPPWTIPTKGEYPLRHPRSGLQFFNMWWFWWRAGELNRPPSSARWESHLPASSKGGQPPWTIPTKGEYPLRHPRSGLQFFNMWWFWWRGRGIEPPSSSARWENPPPRLFQRGQPPWTIPTKGEYPLRHPRSGLQFFNMWWFWWRAGELNPRPRTLRTSRSPN